jgi:hypothetical protein
LIFAITYIGTLYGMMKSLSKKNPSHSQLCCFSSIVRMYWWFFFYCFFFLIIVLQNKLKLKISLSCKFYENKPAKWRNRLKLKATIDIDKWTNRFRQFFWWNAIKRRIVEFNTGCMEFFFIAIKNIEIHSIQLKNNMLFT